MLRNILKIWLLMAFALFAGAAQAANYFIASPGYAVISTTGNTITLTGSGTSWNGSTVFTVSAGSCTYANNSGTSETLTFTAPATAQIIDIDDTTDSLHSPLVITAVAPQVYNNFNGASTSNVTGSTPGAGAGWLNSTVTDYIGNFLVNGIGLAYPSTTYPVAGPVVLCPNTTSGAPFTYYLTLYAVSSSAIETGMCAVDASGDIYTYASYNGGALYFQRKSSTNTGANNVDGGPFSTPPTWTNGNMYVLTMAYSGASAYGGSSQWTVSITNNGTTTTKVTSFADATYTPVTQIGIWSNNAAGSPTAGTLLANAIVVYTGLSVTAQATTFTSDTNSTITVATTAATGALGPYTYQFQIAPDVSGSPGTWANDGSATSSLTHTYNGLTPGNKYWERVEAIDSSPTPLTAYGSDITTTVPNGILMVGPTTAWNGDQTGNFTVTVPSSYTTGTLTMSDSSGGGTFSPATITVTSATTIYTFKYTPGSVGTKSISLTSSPAINNPTPISVVVTNPTSGTLTFVLATSDPESTLISANPILDYDGETIHVNIGNSPTLPLVLVGGAIYGITVRAAPPYATGGSPTYTNYPVASGSVSGSMLTVVLSTPIPAGYSVQYTLNDLNVSDSSGGPNYEANVTNQPIANFSCVSLAYSGGAEVNRTGLLIPNTVLSAWRAARANAATTRADITVNGDSTTNRAGLIEWPYYAAGYLTSGGVAYGGRGRISNWDTTSTAPPVDAGLSGINSNTGWVSDANAYSIAPNASFLSTTAGNVIEFQGYGNSWRVDYGDYGGQSSQFTISVDGGTAVTFDPNSLTNASPSGLTLTWVANPYWDGKGGGWTNAGSAAGELEIDGMSGSAASPVLHTLTITNLGQTSYPPPGTPTIPSSGTTWWVATQVIGTGQTIASLPFQGAATGSTGVTSWSGSGVYNLYVSAGGSSGPFTYRGQTTASGGYANYEDATMASPTSANPPTTSTAGVNTSNTSCAIIPDIFYSKGICFSNDAIGGGSSTFFGGGLYDAYSEQLVLGANLGISSGHDYTQTAGTPPPYRHNVLAITNEGINDVGGNNTGTTYLAQNTMRFLAECSNVGTTPVICAPHFTLGFYGQLQVPAIIAQRNVAVLNGVCFGSIDTADYEATYDQVNYTNVAVVSATTTTITAAQPMGATYTSGDFIQFSSGTATTGLRNIEAFVTNVSGSGPYVLSVSPTLPYTPSSSDTMTVMITNNFGNPHITAPSEQEEGQWVATHLLLSNAPGSAGSGRSLDIGIGKGL